MKHVWCIEHVTLPYIRDENIFVIPNITILIANTHLSNPASN